MRPAQCAACHGGNGAQPRNHPQACQGCHSPVACHLPQTDFSHSGGCPACHG
jgi:DnaJ-class molecular chaperone